MKNKMGITIYLPIALFEGFGPTLQIAMSNKIKSLSWAIVLRAFVPR